MEQLFTKVLNPRTPKILAIGKNYLGHAKEMGDQEVPKEPVVFQKPWSSILLPGQGITLPKHNNEVHHEIELGFLICKTGRNIAKEDWKNHVGGYFLAIDFTDRDKQAYLKKNSFPWDISKGQDGFLPVSNFIPLEKVKDPYELELKLTINNKVVQNDKASSMYFKISDILHFVSSYMTLNEGDLFLTGTPSGIGPVRENDNFQAQLLQGPEVIAEINSVIKKEK